MEQFDMFSQMASCVSEVRRVKRFREKDLHLDDFHFALEIGEDHGNVAAEFPDELAAGAARGSESIGVSDDGNGVEAALAFADGFENGDAFGANGEAVGGIFDVATAEDSAGSGVKGGANAKIRKRRVGIFARLQRGFDQWIHVMPPGVAARL